MDMMVVMVAQLYNFTKHHWAVYLQWVNFMICKVHHNKAVFFFLKNNTSMQAQASQGFLATGFSVARCSPVPSEWRVRLGMWIERGGGDS